MRARQILAQAIASLPFNALRVSAYGLLLGYRMRGARIGWRCVIDVARAEFVGCRVGHHNIFTGPMSVQVGRGSQISSHNVFHCGRWTVKGGATYGRRLEIGEDTVIASRHYFDVAGTFVLGKGSFIGGAGSQFWTHGPGAQEREIRIGEHCYVGSHAIFAPGSGLADHTMVALGSVVARRFRRSHVVIGGVPAETLREEFDWRTHLPVEGAGVPSPD